MPIRARRGVHWPYLIGPRFAVSHFGRLVVLETVQEGSPLGHQRQVDGSAEVDQLQAARRRRGAQQLGRRPAAFEGVQRVGRHQRSSRLTTRTRFKLVLCSSG